MELNIQEAGTQARIYNVAAVMRALKAKVRAKDSKVADQVIFAKGRVKAILSILAYDHVGARCTTDDGVAYFDLLFPYYVELAHLNDEYNFDYARKKVWLHMPVFYKEVGEAFLSDEWAKLCELRAEALKRKLAHPSRQGDERLYWLPTAEKIKRDLNLTRARRAAVNAMYVAHGDHMPIRGIGTVDEITPEEVRRDTLARVTKHNRAKGVKPQSERRQMAEFKDLAAWRGCSLSTIQRKDKNGTLLAYLTGES